MKLVNDSYITFAHELADMAGDIIRPYFRRPHEVNIKADNSPVTIADREAEEAMRSAIRSRFPDHGIMGEEYGNEGVGNDYVWVLDPIDGTRSFITGKPLFGTLISLAFKNTPILGVIDQPILKERWIGVQGEGTTFNGQRIKSRRGVALKHASLATTSPHLFDTDRLVKFDKIRNAAGQTVYGSDCYAYGLLASGFVDAVVESGLKPHDFCALAPIIIEAGGSMTDWKGNAITLQSNGDVVAAGSAALHREILELLQ